MEMINPKKKITPRQIEHNMSAQDIILAVLVLVVAVSVFYMLDPTLLGLLKRREGFVDSDNFLDSQDPFLNGEAPGEFNNSGNADRNVVMNNSANESANDETNSPMNPLNEGFANPITPSPMPFQEAEKPANCYPKNQLAPQELLPNDPNSKWAQVNPMGSGDIAGKNFLNAGSLIGVNTVGQSLRNASWDLRSEPPNPQVQVSPWMQSTIEPELQRRPLEIA
jgi:hypothetical protein